VTSGETRQRDRASEETAQQSSSTCQQHRQTSERELVLAHVICDDQPGLRELAVEPQACRVWIPSGYFFDAFAGYGFPHYLEDINQRKGLFEDDHDTDPQKQASRIRHNNDDMCGQEAERAATSRALAATSRDQVQITPRWIAHPRETRQMIPNRINGRRCGGARRAYGAVIRAASWLRARATRRADRGGVDRASLTSVSLT
jgi:hypothetical protein